MEKDNPLPPKVKSVKTKNTVIPHPSSNDADDILLPTPVIPKKIKVIKQDKDDDGGGDNKVLPTLNINDSEYNKSIKNTFPLFVLPSNFLTVKIIEHIEHGIIYKLTSYDIKPDATTPVSISPIMEEEEVNMSSISSNSYNNEQSLMISKNKLSEEITKNILDYILDQSGEIILEDDSVYENYGIGSSVFGSISSIFNRSNVNNSNNRLSSITISKKLLMKNKISIRKLIKKFNISICDLKLSDIITCFQDLIDLNFNLRDLVENRSLFNVNHLSMICDDTVTCDTMEMYGITINRSNLLECRFTPSELSTLQYDFIGNFIPNNGDEPVITRDDIRDLSYSLDDCINLLLITKKDIIKLNISSRYLVRQLKWNLQDAMHKFGFDKWPIITSSPSPNEIDNTYNEITSTTNTTNTKGKGRKHRQNRNNNNNNTNRTRRKGKIVKQNKKKNSSDSNNDNDTTSDLDIQDRFF